MAAGSRTLKLTILGDVDNLKKSLNQADDDVKKSSSGFADFSSKAGLAFAAAGAAAAIYAGKLLVDGVKAAIEDQAAQDKLATSLKNVTGSTNEQIKSVESYITKTSLANGVTDTELRPSLDRLVRSTLDVKEAQDLQTLALDIAAGSGKDLAAVSEALAKAHDGNFGALKRLGITIDESIIKSKDFDAATAALAKTFEGQASVQADTFQGKMDRLGIAFDEAKETVGGYILDALTPLLDGFVNNVIPAIQSVSENLGKTLGPAFNDIFKIIKEDVLPILTEWWNFLSTEVVPAIGTVVKPIFEALKNAFDKIKQALIDNQDELQPFYDFLKKVWEFVKTYLAPYLGSQFAGAIDGVTKAITFGIDAFTMYVQFLTDVYNGLKKIVNFVENNSVLKGSSGVLGLTLFGGGKAVGGPVSNGTSYLVGERGPEIFTPNGNGFITPNNRLGGSSGNIFNITVNGAIDSEGTARSIINVLNNSFYRGTGGATALVS